MKHLPPAPTPEAVVPPIIQGAPPPAAGQGRLVVDVVDGPAPVQRMRMGSVQVDDGKGRIGFRFSEEPTLLCEHAPCVTDVPPGNLLLGFPVIGKEGLETELVHVGPDTSVYRRSLSVYRDETGGTRIMGIIATAVGGTSMMTGSALLPIGLAGGHDGLTVAGSVTLGVGAALLVIGIWAIHHDAPTFRPGSSNHFPVAP